MCPLFHGVPGGMYEIPTRSRRNCCSTCEINSGPLSIRNTNGGPPHNANTLSSSSVNRPAVIDRSTMFGQRLAGVLVDHRRDLDRLAVDGGVELEVYCPQHVRCISFDLRTRTDASTFTRMLDPHLQPNLAGCRRRGLPIRSMAVRAVLRP